MQIPSVPSPLSFRLLLISLFCSPSFPCLGTLQAQAQPPPSSLEPGKLRAAGTEQALPGKDRCKSSGFHMKRSCLE